MLKIGTSEEKIFKIKKIGDGRPQCLACSAYDGRLTTDCVRFALENSFNNVSWRSKAQTILNYFVRRSITVRQTSCTQS